MKTKRDKLFTLLAAVGLASVAWATVPSGTKTISYSGQTLPQYTTGDSGVYDYVCAAFNEGGTLELSFTMTYNGNNCGAYQCIFHAGASGTGFSIYENGGPHLIFSTKNQTSSTYELSTSLTSGDHTIVCRFEGASTGSATVSVDIDGVRNERGTWALTDMGWSSSADERNKYSMGCQAPGYTNNQKLQTTTIANNTITATYTAAPSYDYAATISESRNWTALDWNPTWPSGGDAGAMATVTNTSTAATLTVNAAETMNTLTVVSQADKLLTIADATNLTATAYDFSAANGKVTFDCTGLTTNATLISGEVTGYANVDTTGVGVQTGYHLYADATGVYFVADVYRDKFASNPAVFTWGGGNNAFHAGTYKQFSIYTGKNTGTDFTGNTDTSTFPGWEGTSFKPYYAFSLTSSGGKYKAPGYVLRLAADDGSANKTMDAQFNDLAFGGMYVETGATGYSFTSANGGNRSTDLGDNRTTGGVDTWFIFNEDFLFKRGNQGNTEANAAVTLFGAINFDIASGKTVTLNTFETNCKPKLDTASHAALKMHGAGKIALNTLVATGDVTLDYSDLSVDRTTPYISGTVKMDANTLLVLPATLQKNVQFPIATAVSGVESGVREIKLGSSAEAVEKFVTFTTTDGIAYVSYSDVSQYKATLAADGAFADLAWVPTKPTEGFTTEDELIVTNSAAATLTFTTPATADVFKVCNAASEALTLKISAADMNVREWNFSAAAGKVTFDFTGITETTNLISGTITGTENIDTTAPDGFKLVVSSSGVTLKKATDLMLYGYSYNGNGNKRSDASSSFTTATTSNFREGVTDQAMYVNGESSYGTGFALGTDDFTAVFVARTSGTTDKIFYGFGQGGKSGFDFMSNGSTGIKFANWSSGAKVFDVSLNVADGSDATIGYHVYAVKYTKSTGKVSWSVDGGVYTEVATAFQYDGNDRWQIGSIHTSIPSGCGSKGDAGVLDEMRFYTACLSQAQLQAITSEFTDKCYTATLTGGMGFSSIKWDGSKIWTGGSDIYVGLRVTSDTETVLTLDTAVNARVIRVISEDGKDLKISKGTDQTLAITGYDFYDALGKTTVNYQSAGTIIIPGAETVMNSMPQVAIEVKANKKLTLNWNAIDTQFTHAITGAGAVDVTGNVLVNCDNSAQTWTLTVKDGGRFKMGSGNCLPGRTVTADAGGVLDPNGKHGNSGEANKFILNGGKIENSTAIAANKIECKGIDVMEDSQIGGTADYDFIYDSFGAYTVALGGNTLSKVDANKYRLCSAQITGTGKIKVEAGTLGIYGATAVRTTAFTGGGVLEIAGGTLSIDNSNAKLIVSNLVVTSGTIANSGAIAGLASLGGTVDFTAFTGSGSYAFADEVTVASGTTKLNATAATALANKTVTVAEGATLDLNGQTLTGVKLLGAGMVTDSAATKGSIAFADGTSFSGTIGEGLAMSMTSGNVILAYATITGNNAFAHSGGTVYLNRNQVLSVTDGTVAATDYLLFYSDANLLNLGGVKTEISYTGANAIFGYLDDNETFVGRAATIVDGKITLSGNTATWTKTSAANWYDAAAWKVGSGESETTVTWFDGCTSPVILTDGANVSITKDVTPSSVTLSGTTYINGHSHLKGADQNLAIGTGKYLYLFENATYEGTISGAGGLILQVTGPAVTNMVTSATFDNHTGSVYLYNAVYPFSADYGKKANVSQGAQLYLVDDTAWTSAIQLGGAGAAIGETANTAQIRFGKNVTLGDASVLLFSSASNAGIAVDEGATVNGTISISSLSDSNGISKYGAGTFVASISSAFENANGPLAIKEGTFQFGNETLTTAVSPTLCTAISVASGAKFFLNAASSTSAATLTLATAITATGTVEVGNASYILSSLTAKVGSSLVAKGASADMTVTFGGDADQTFTNLAVNQGTVDFDSMRNIKLSDLDGTGVINVTLTEEEKTSGASIIVFDTAVAELPSGVLFKDGGTFLGGTIGSDGKTISVKPDEYTGAIHAEVSEGTVNFSAIAWLKEDGSQFRTDITKVSAATLTNNATVVMDASATLTALSTKLTIGGSGNVTVSAASDPTWTWQSGENGWTGTYVVNGTDDAANAHNVWNLYTWYNGTYSKVQLNCSKSGYFYNASKEYGELAIAEGKTVTINDAYSTDTHKFAKLSGAGTFCCDNNVCSKNAYQQIWFGNVDEFCGTLKLVKNPSKYNGFRMMLGATTGDVDQHTISISGTVTLMAGARLIADSSGSVKVLSGATLKVNDPAFTSSPLNVNGGTLDLSAVDASSAWLTPGTTTFASSSSIIVPELAALESGTYTVLGSGAGSTFTTGNITFKYGTTALTEHSVAVSGTTATLTTTGSRMYFNRLSGSAEVPAGTYGAITLPSPAKATAYAETTQLSNTEASPEIVGSYSSVIKRIGNVVPNTHTACGWFLIPETSEEKVLWYAIGTHSSHSDINGYAVKVTSEGKIKFGIANTDFSWTTGRTPIEFSATVASGWHHIAVAVTTANNSSTPQLYVDGVKYVNTTSVASSLWANPEQCSNLGIGAGVSAAGLYITPMAISDADSVVKIATSRQYVNMPFVWIGENGGSWNVAANWSLGEVPTSGARVSFPLEAGEDDYTVTIGDSANITLSSLEISGTAGSFGFTGAGTVAADDFSCVANLTIPEGVTMQLKGKELNTKLTDGKKVSGAGTIVMVGEGTSGTELRLNYAKLSGLTETVWTGTVELKDWNGATQGWDADFNGIANGGSKIRFNGFSGYALTTATCTHSAKEFVIGDNGAAFVGAFSTGDIAFAGKFSGSGNITIGTTGAGTVKFIGDVTDYTGTIGFADGATFRGAILNSSGTTLPTVDSKTMVIGTGVTGGVWTVNANCVLMDGVCFDSTKVPTFSQNLTLGSTAVVTLQSYGDMILNKTGLTVGTVYGTTLSGTVGGEALTSNARLQATAEGIVVRQIDTITWKGGSGSITNANWNGGTYAEKASGGIVKFPENAESETITVPDGTAAAMSMDVSGEYVFKGEGNGKVWSVGALSAADKADITLDALTLDVQSLNVSAQKIKLVNGAHLIATNATMTLAANETLTIEAGTCYTLGLTPTFNATSAIKIDNATALTEGMNYKLIEWKDWSNPDLLSYGMPQLNITGYAGESSRVRLVPQVYDVTLQVMSEAQANRKPLVIMPIGDSITEGLNNKDGSGKNYRIPLFNKLSLAGYNVKSVGYWKHNGGAANGSYDPSGTVITNPDWIYHCGKGSMRAGAMGSGNASVHDSWANDIDLAGNPDVVLLHIGINDMLNNGSNDDTDGTKTYKYLTNIITRAVNSYPATTFVISSPMCCEYGHKKQMAEYAGDGKTDYNKNFCTPLHTMMTNFYAKARAGEIDGLTADAAEKIFFADLYQNVMPRWYGTQPDTFLNDGSDHCHPNWLGHELMAQTWFDQITNAFPSVENTSGNYTSTPTEVSESQKGAAANVPSEYLNGFVKVRVWKPEATGRLTTGQALTYTWTNEDIADNAAIEKVAYFFEYVRPTATENLHRWVWTDMDAFGDSTTVADVGVPTTKKTQQVVNNLHVYGNHPAVWNVARATSGVQGFIEFSPYGTAPEASGVSGAPANWFNFDWNDTLNSSGAYGCMQVHRILATQDINRPAQVVFAYNGFTTTDSATYPGYEFGIGNFAQSFASPTGMDWTDLRKTETMTSTNLSYRSIEIWVKPKAEARIGGKYYVTLGDALEAAESGDEVVLLENVETNGILTVQTGVNVECGAFTLTADTLNLNAGSTFKADDGARLTVTNVFSLGDGVDFRIKTATTNGAVIATVPVSFDVSGKTVKVYGATGYGLANNEGVLSLVKNTPTVVFDEIDYDVTQPLTNFNGSVVVAKYKVLDSGDGTSYTLGATITIDGEDYTGEIDKENRTISFTLPSSVVVAGKVYTGVITVTSTKSGVAEAEVQDASNGVIYQGKKQDEPEASAWIDESVATFKTTGTWTPEPETNANYIVISEDATNVFTPKTAQKGQKVVFDANVTFDAPDDFEVDFEASQGGIKLVTDAEDDEVYRFAMLLDGAWVTNTTEEASLETSYTIRTTIDYHTGKSTVTYELVGDTTKTLGTGTTGSISNSVSNIEFTGDGLVTSFKGTDYIDQVDASLVKDGDGNKYADIDEATEAGKSDLTLLWDTAWNPDATKDGDWVINCGGYNFYVDSKEGVHIAKDGDTYRIISNYYEVMQYLANGSATNKVMYFVNAFGQNNATNVLLRDVTLTNLFAIANSVTLDGQTHEIVGGEEKGLNLGANVTLKITGGYINTAITTNDTQSALVLEGGKYTADGTNAFVNCVAEGYHFASLANLTNYEGYVAQVVKGEAPLKPEDEVVFPVGKAENAKPEEVATNYVGEVAFSKDWLVQKKVVENVEDINTNAAAVATKLNTIEKNKIATWENLVLGLDGSVSNSIPVIQPVQTVDTDKITFQLGGVDVDTGSGVKVEYKVWTGLTPGAKTTSSATAAHDVTTAMPLPDKGVKYYTIEVITTPAK